MNMSTMSLIPPSLCYIAISARVKTIQELYTKAEDVDMVEGQLTNLMKLQKLFGVHTPTL